MQLGTHGPGLAPTRVFVFPPRNSRRSAIHASLFANTSRSKECMSYEVPASIGLCLQIHDSRRACFRSRTSGMDMTVQRGMDRLHAYAGGAHNHSSSGHRATTISDLHHPDHGNYEGHLLPGGCKDHPMTLIPAHNSQLSSTFVKTVPSGHRGAAMLNWILPSMFNRLARPGLYL